MALTNEENELLAKWKLARVAAATATLEERALRDKVIETFSLITDELHASMENVDIGFGFDLKIQHKVGYKLDNSNDCEPVHKCIDAFIKLRPNEGPILSDRLFKQKFEISVTEYKLLDPELKALVDGILTVKPESKSVEIKQRGKK